MLGTNLGLGLGSAAVLGGVAPPSNPNLLLWTEEFDNAAWTKTDVTMGVDAGVDPLAGMTAESITAPGAAAAVRQIVATAASAGGPATAVINTTAGWTRHSVMGVFDGLDYAFSIYIKDLAGGLSDLRLVLDRLGGFLRCSIEDVGDAEEYYIWGAQLEQAASPSAYQRRTT